MSRSQRTIKASTLIWDDTTVRSPYLNMAFDEQCLIECGKSGDLTLRFYGWDRPSISIGYFQTYNSVSDQRYAVVRRPTGGGIVFHDHGITYSIAIPSSHGLYQTSRRESYHIISMIVIGGLSRSGIKATLNRNPKTTSSSDRHCQKCFENPAPFDVIVNGLKLAGAAQKRNRWALLHQGYINLSKFPHINIVPLKANLILEFENIFADKMIQYTPSASFLNSANLLAKEKFNTAGWNKKR